MGTKDCVWGTAALAAAALGIFAAPAFGDCRRGDVTPIVTSCVSGFVRDDSARVRRDKGRPVSVDTRDESAVERAMSFDGGFYPWISGTDAVNTDLSKGSDGGLFAPLEHSNVQRWSADSCPFGKIEDIDETAGMAKISCQRARTVDPSDANLGFWVNLDTLACHPRNITTYRDRIDHATGACMAPSLPDAFYDHHPELLPHSALAQRASGVILEGAQKRVLQARHRASSDQHLLAQAYSAMSDQQLLAALGRARSALAARYRQAACLFGVDCAGDPKARRRTPAVEAGLSCPEWKAPPEPLPDACGEQQVTQGQRACQLLKAADQMIRDKLDTPDGRTARTIIEALSRDRNRVGYDQLALRSILFAGLDESAQAALYNGRNARRTGSDDRRLYYVRRAEEARGLASCYLAQSPSSMTGAAVYELHDGYTFGGSRFDADKSGLEWDCSDLATTLFAEAIKDAAGDGPSGPPPTTYDLMNIAKAAAREKAPELKAGWRRFVPCLTPVDMRAGEVPQPGDMIVRNGEGGHVVVVTGYDAEHGTVATAEAAGGRMNAVANYQRTLFEPSCHGSPSDLAGRWDTRPLRADLHILRLTPDAAGCPMSR